MQGVAGNHGWHAHEHCAPQHLNRMLQLMNAFLQVDLEAIVKTSIRTFSNRSPAMFADSCKLLTPAQRGFVLHMCLGQPTEP